MSSADVRGRFVWYELNTTDPKAAKAFYTKIVGWGLQDFPGGDIPYTMWTRGGQPIGGVWGLSEDALKAGASPHWLAYVGTPKVDDTVAQAKDLGAKVLVPPTDIPGTGRFAVVADPQGASFGVYTSASEPGPEAPPQVMDFSWHELMTTDHVAAFSFYNALFGWEKSDAMDMGPMGVYQMYSRKGTMLGGMFNRSAEMPPPMWWLYVLVPDVHKGGEAVTSLGGKIMNGPMEVPGGDWIVQCADPQGAVFALHHKKAS